jgi:hypothetical protein
MIVFSVLALAICGLVWFLGKHRVQWTWIDYSSPILPVMLWIILIGIKDPGKSLANVAIDLFWLGGSVIVAPIIRLIIGKNINQKLLAIILLIILCFIAVGFWMFMPCLPE